MKFGCLSILFQEFTITRLRDQTASIQTSKPYKQSRSGGSAFSLWPHTVNIMFASASIANTEMMCMSHYHHYVCAANALTSSQTVIRLTIISFDASFSSDVRNPSALYVSRTHHHIFTYHDLRIEFKWDKNKQNKENDVHGKDLRRIGQASWVSNDGL